MTDNDDAQDQAEKLRQFFSVAQEFTNDFFGVMIKQIETFDCSDEERVIFTTFVARSNLATATNFCWKWKITRSWSARLLQPGFMRGTSVKKPNKYDV